MCVSARCQVGAEYDVKMVAAVGQEDTTATPWWWRQDEDVGGALGGRQGDLHGGRGVRQLSR